MRSVHNTYVQLFTSEQTTIKVYRLISMYANKCDYIAQLSV